MDQPITYRDYRRDLIRTSENLYLLVHYAVCYDEKDEFLRLIKDPGFERIRCSFTTDKIFQCDALQIAISVLNGESNGNIDFKDAFKDGMTPLHLAAVRGAPRLTKYFIDQGHNVDAMCDRFSLKQATPLDLALSVFGSFEERKSLFELLFRFCFHHRPNLEVARLLVQNTKNIERVRKAFSNYAYKGQLPQFGALFLAAPQLFLSSNFRSLGGGLSTFGMLYLMSNSLEKRADIEEYLSLLLDVFAIVGDKLVAYIRLEETSNQITELTMMEIDFLLREVSRRKLGVSSPDYYFRFFKSLSQEDDDPSSTDVPVVQKNTWEDLGHGEEPGPWMFIELPYVLMEEDIDQAKIYSQLPILEPDDSDRLNRAIQKKLSSMSPLHCNAEDMTRRSKKEEKHLLPQWFLPLSARNREHTLRSFFTRAGAKSWVDVKFTPTNTLVNKVMQETKLKSFFSLVPFQLLNIFKHLRK